MKAKLKFLAIYYLSWILFFDIMRLVFMLYHHDRSTGLSWSTLAASFWYGLRMDLSAAAYIVAPVFLFVLLSLFIHFFRRLTIYKIYTFTILLIVALISLADLELYNAWGFRIDTTPLRFLSTPHEAWASVSHLPLFWIALVFLICYGLFYFCFKTLLKHIFFQQQNKGRILTGVVLLVLMVALIIPVRGGLQLAPLNQSSVYYSTSNYANHTAINATWNFLHSLFSKGASGKNPYQYFAGNTYQPVVDSLYLQDSLPVIPTIRFSDSIPTNIILIVWESLTEKAFHTQGTNGTPILPQLQSLRREGIYFSNAYASGDRTNKGIPAVFSGYPAMPNTTIIHNPGKSVKLPVITQGFRQKGYQTPFYYGGEPEFANIKSYLLHAGFDPIVGKDDFSAQDMNSKWGAHDGVVMKRLQADLTKLKQPFFAGWLTLSSHEPFETPVPVAIPGHDQASQFLNSLHYTDQVLGEFIRYCRQQSWWAHTLVIIVGDHGHPLPSTGHKADDFRTPMLWLGGAVMQPGREVKKVVSQLDIAASLQMQAGIKPAGYPFSKNIFTADTAGWAFFTFNNGFGFVNENGRLVYDNVGRRPIEQEGRAGEAEIRAGKAMQQATYEDFIRK